MLRVVVSEEGQAELPPIDVDDARVVVIGSDASAQVRLPASAAKPVHVRIEGGRWHLVDGDSGAIGDGAVVNIGSYRVRIAPAPAGVAPTPPQRTESLARELMRSLLGGDSAPSLEVERGPVVGAKRPLPPPESVTVIGRGDEANWILLDEDLSRMHAEVRRGWDETRIVDLDSKNGTRVDGVAVGADGAVLHDGALVELGKVALRFRDPAEKQGAAVEERVAAETVVATPIAAKPDAAKPVRAEAAVAPRAAASQPVAAPRPSTAPFYLAVGIMLAALVGLVWILSV